jgi:hypothetical protein
MKLREALIKQAPSLALQRAAADEIAKQDALIKDAMSAIKGMVRNFPTYEELRDIGWERAETDQACGYRDYAERIFCKIDDHMESK